MAGIAILDALEDRGRDLRSFVDQAIDALRAALRGALAKSPAAGPLADLGYPALAAAARRLAAIDPANAAPGGMRFHLELALLRPAGPIGWLHRRVPASIPVAAARAVPPPRLRPRQLERRGCSPNGERCRRPPGPRRTAAATRAPAPRRPPTAAAPEPRLPRPRPRAEPDGRAVARRGPGGIRRSARGAPPPLARGRGAHQPAPADEAAHRGLPAPGGGRRDGHARVPGEPALPARRRRPSPADARGRPLASARPAGRGQVRRDQRRHGRRSRRPTRRGPR